jgi:hypothetical protein
VKPLTPMQIERIVEMTKAGVYVSTIEKRLGIGKDELWRRIHIGEVADASDTDRAFSKTFRSAEAECEETLCQTTFAEARVNPEFALKLLERRFPKRWAGRSDSERENEPQRPRTDMPKDDARDIAKRGRLRAVKGGG